MHPRGHGLQRSLSVKRRIALIIEEYLLTVAKAVATRSKCRTKVGCVIADKNGRILSCGYNGHASGMKNCSSDTCTNPPGISGECGAIHSEVNALIWLKQPEDAYYVAVTKLPCHTCASALLNIPGKVLIYDESCSYSESLNLLRSKYELRQITLP